MDDTTRKELLATLENNGLDAALWLLERWEDETPALLMKVAVCQDILHLMKDERSRDFVKVTHLYAYGEVSREEFITAMVAARAAFKAARKNMEIWGGIGVPAHAALAAYRDFRGAAEKAAHAAWNVAWGVANDTAWTSWDVAKDVVKDARNAAGLRKATVNVAINSAESAGDVAFQATRQKQEAHFRAIVTNYQKEG